MKTYKIEIDVLEAVHDFYPGLSVEEASKIADSIVDKWDYTHDYDSINDDISWYADAHGIELEGKDGIEEPALDDRNNVLILNPPPSRLFP